MPEASILVNGEGEEPSTLEQCAVDLDAPVSDEDDYPLRELLDDVGIHFATYDVYSCFSMFAAIWALQRIAARDGDELFIARTALGEIAMSGDFEEQAIETGGKPMFTLPPIERTEHGSYDWAVAE